MKKPDIYGRYLLIERVSIGGMAEVFKAMTVGLSGFKKTLAIKRVLPNISEDESFVNMFVDEANIAGQLHHANIAQIYDLGSIDETYFIAMEYVEGKDLRSIFDKVRKSKKPIPIEMSAFVCSQLLAALDYAHRKKDEADEPMNIVHRDVSPPNIILSYDGDIKLIDFGIAKAAKKASKTQAGVLKGKFSYMSPEQIRGMTVDGRSDVFSVGIVLYEMLAHKRLFVGETDFETLEKVRGMEISPPSETNEAVPEELDKIVLKALKRDVKERYQSAEEMQHDLQRYLYAQTPVFTERSLSNWMTTTFSNEFNLSKERMSEIENLDLNELGINVESLNSASMHSLKSDPANKVETASKSKKSTPKRRTSDAENVTTIDIDGNLPVSSIFSKVVTLSIILLSFAIVFWYILDKSPQHAITLGNTESTGTAVFLANVEGVEVVFRDNVLCKTPCKINDFWTGKHEVTFLHPTLLHKLVPFEIKPEKETRVTAKLHKREDVPSALIVRTAPEGADIFVNGVKRDNKTPISINNLKASRSYEISLEKAGYKKLIKRVLLDKNGISSRKFILEPLSPSVVINSVPEKAEIWLDGKKTDKLTPAKLDMLENGKQYEVTLKLAKYKDTKFSYIASEKIEYNFCSELEKKRSNKGHAEVSIAEESDHGWLNIYTNLGSEIHIDGKFTGRYSPATDIKLGKGTHQLKLISKDFKVENTSMIEIKAGQINRISKQLKVSL